MKRTPFLPLLFAVLVALSISRPIFSQGVQIETAPATEHSPTPAPTPTAAEALYDYIQKHGIVVAKYRAGTRYLWTDQMFIEIADGPPPEPLASLLAAGPNNTSQFSTWVHETFETQLKAWQPATKNPKPSKQGTDEIVSETGGKRCFINPVYMSYVLDRYPKARILIKGPTDPALFTVNGQLRAVVSPWTKLPDGTPLVEQQ